jgi:hypothetical protein
MNAEEARKAAANSHERIRRMVFSDIEAMASFGKYKVTVYNHYP